MILLIVCNWITRASTRTADHQIKRIDALLSQADSEAGMGRLHLILLELRVRHSTGSLVVMLGRLAKYIGQRWHIIITR
jgi:hypothetical protein